MLLCPSAKTTTMISSIDLDLNMANFVFFLLLFTRGKGVDKIFRKHTPGEASKTEERLCRTDGIRRQAFAIFAVFR